MSASTDSRRRRPGRTVVEQEAFDEAAGRERRRKTPGRRRRIRVDGAR